MTTHDQHESLRSSWETWWTRHALLRDYKNLSFEVLIVIVSFIVIALLLALAANLVNGIVL